jgi:hypothetical protein
MFEWLKNQNICDAGTIRVDKFMKPLFTNDKEIKKHYRRGYMKNLICITSGVLLIYDAKRFLNKQHRGIKCISFRAERFGLNIFNNFSFNLRELNRHGKNYYSKRCERFTSSLPSLGHRQINAIDLYSTASHKW